MSSSRVNLEAEMLTRSLAEGAYWKPRILALLAVLLIAAALLVKLDQAPALWWDEGWTLMLARNWVEQGFFGQIMDGQRLPPGLAASPVVTGFAALSFKLFGVGAWQGRLPFAVLTLANLVLMFYIARRLYPRPVAWGMLLVMLFLPVGTAIHPIVAGRQAMGEMPSIFFLLLGMVCFERALTKPWIWGPLASISWGVALVTKVQVLPFWLASTGLAFLIAMLKRQWRSGLITALITAGAMMVGWLALPRLENLLLGGMRLPPQPLQDLMKTVALVTDLQVRWFALRIVLLAGLIPLFGILHGGWKAIKTFNKEETSPESTLLRWAMLGLAGSWMAWYVGLAMFWPRYLFPASFFGSLFAAAMLYDLTDRSDLRLTFQKAAQVFTVLREGKSETSVFSSRLRCLVIVIVCVSLTALTLLNLSQFVQEPGSPPKVAAYMKEIARPDDLIETYESELMFLLGDRRFHYPPDQVSVDLVKRSFTERFAVLDYDPLAADPDYLVVGPFSSAHQLYDLWLTGDNFTLIKEFPGYRIYARVRK